MIAIKGNTFPVKDKLRALGGRWDADEKVWKVPPAKAEEARKLVENAPKQEATGKCAKCKRPVKPPFTVCYGCKQNADGKCAKCGEGMSKWERDRGMRLCSNCRDGGGNAHGGMSYYDRNGRFVLGDDD